MITNKNKEFIGNLYSKLVEVSKLPKRIWQPPMQLRVPDEYEQLAERLCRPFTTYMNAMRKLMYTHCKPNLPKKKKDFKGNIFDKIRNKRK